MNATLDEILVQPGDETWDRSRQAWNLTVDQRPAAVALPRSADDVTEIVSWAQSRGLRVAAQGTGHGAAAHDSLDGTVLVKTTHLDQIQIDPELCRARVGAGVVWSDVSAAAAEFGLAALAGSGPDVGVVGYTLGGGISWLARRYGLASNAVLAAEIVTADGRLVRTDRFHEPDLFWALRGGGGAFGVVTALEFELYPVPEVYAGTLFWPMEDAERVLNAWKTWTEGAPRDLTTCVRLLNLPPLPDLPAQLRGRAFVAIEVAYAGEQSSAIEHLQPMRNLGPELDTATTIPAAELGSLHLDPEHPVPGKGNGGLLSALPAGAIASMVATAGAGTNSPLLSVEIRQLGGALAHPVDNGGALAAIEAPYGIYSVGIAATPDLGRAIDARISALAEALAPWQAPHSYLNFDDRAESADALFPADTYRRLRAVKAAYDPSDLFLSNHPIPPANPGKA